MQYTEQELSKLISDLETEFTMHLAKAEFGATQADSLNKNEDEKPAKESKEKDPEAEQEPEEKEDKPSENSESKPEEKESEDAPAKEAAPVADESGYSPEDIAHIDAMYMSMSKAELLAHHDSCVRALDAIGAEHVHSNPAPSAPAAPEASPNKEMDMQMSKSENKNEELELAKSEASAAKAKAEELQKSLNGIQEFLTQLVKKVPQGKAITSLEQVSKSETNEKDIEKLSKSEITSILTKKAADPKLNENDKNAIKDFYLNKTNINTISHLLK